MKWDLQGFLQRLRNGFDAGEKKQAEVKSAEDADLERLRKENEANQKEADKALAEWEKEQKRIKDDQIYQEKLKQEKWKTKLLESKTGETPTVPSSTTMGVGDTNGIEGYTRGAINPEYVKIINDFIASLDTGTSLTPALLASAVNTESGFNPNAYNNGDRGISQFSSKWRPDITDEIAYDPTKAIPAMGKTLNDYIGNTGNIPQGIAAYNVGLGRVGMADGRNEYGLGPKGMEYIRKIAANLSKEESQKLGLDIFQ